MRNGLTVVILAILIIFSVLYYGIFQGSIEAEIAVRQLEDSTVGYSVSKSVAKDSIPIAAWVLGLSILVLMWIPKRKKTK